jgi:hypothetical protein
LMNLTLKEKKMENISIWHHHSLVQSCFLEGWSLTIYITDI